MSANDDWEERFDAKFACESFLTSANIKLFIATELAAAVKKTRLDDATFAYIHGAYDVAKAIESCMGGEHELG